ncbi:hypothetical protein [Stenotrophomonas sp. 169]|uniref:hypothetical protein n=1 Tax=Stenotrophomonas sp. 169 TaxID=2770322 RepID=UPI001CB79AB2|nr:hypothetical protein [Stenotrophomonas sp. 169]
MSGGASAVWTPAQQAWLQAMGYTVLHDSALAVALEAVAATHADASDGPRPPQLSDDAVRISVAPMAVPPRRAPPAPVDESADGKPRPPPRPRPAAPVAQVAQEPIAPGSVTGTPRQPAVRLPDRLQMALLRASGCNPNDPATQALMESWPLDTLRGNAAAKRALWPQLRALRRKPGA